MRSVLILLMTVSSGVWAKDITGVWGYQSNNGKNVYNLDIKTIQNKKHIKYSFIYMNGKRINESGTKGYTLIKSNDGCYTSTLYDAFLGEYAGVKLCLQGQTLVFNKTSKFDSTPYLPKKAVFRKEK
ncbi:hypothetical protein [Vibrio tritonius]|uniref:hypothetical protein n=1 Tax=Vibrio tritonius TaxID=1435069 RepID=UPI000B2F3556|nr:hypothetical protein [Vibrio tritonius]